MEKLSLKTSKTLVFDSAQKFLISDKQANLLIQEKNKKQ